MSQHTYSLQILNISTKALLTFVLLGWTIMAQALIFDNGSRRAKVSEAPVKLKTAARSVASVFASSGFIQQDDGSYLVKKYQMNSVPNSAISGSLRMLCETELYSREYRAESLKGSGLLITPQHIVVPAHLFDRPSDCKDKKVVFNYTGDEDLVPKEAVYTCVERQFIRYDLLPKFRPEDREFGSSKYDGHMDYAFIKLDREVKDIEPAKTREETKPLKVGDQLYFVSSMRGLNQTFEGVDVKYVSPAVVSTNASTAQGSSGGIYFTDEGYFVGMHISSNPASNEIDNDSSCLKWVKESTETFDWQSLVFIKDRGTERPFGALMLPLPAFKKRLFGLQAKYYENLAAEQEAQPQALPVSKKEEKEDDFPDNLEVDKEKPTIEEPSKPPMKLVEDSTATEKKASDSIKK